jgi:tRNA A37 methylthiotransferase MiaB
MHFAHIHAFTYSARAGTPAARFAGQVPEPERKRRVRQLTALDAALRQAVVGSFIGQTRPVLWEARTRSATRPAPAAAEPEAAVWTGLTDNYLRVQLRAPASLDLHNHITPVYLERLDDDIVWGRFADTGTG